ncbi:MAG: FtsQ-type POTRA domain-containing protein [Bacillota bacterium]|nr:FtsQ-type POTRA domain-containing protein [Bacillota bacterium]
MNDVRDLRRKNRKRKYRRRKTGLFFGVFSFLVVLAAVAAAITVFFKISNVEISGKTRYSQEEVLDASGIRTGTNMFLINKFTTINRMFSKLVYLDEIRIRRKLPDTVEIIVSDTEPAAAVEISGKYWLLDKRGKLLEPVSEEKAKQAGIVKGLTAQSAAAGEIIEPDDKDKLQKLTEFFAAAYKSGIAGDIGDIDFTKIYNVSFSYGNRFTVLIGEASDFDRKFRFLLSVKERLSPSDRGVIDLTDAESARFRPEGF